MQFGDALLLVTVAAVTLLTATLAALTLVRASARQVAFDWSYGYHSGKLVAAKNAAKVLNEEGVKDAEA